MRVSLIIPVYNGERTIARCVESALNQTLEDVEIIIIDDGSTDNTPDILKGFSDSRVRVITQKNSGQGFARNAGIAAAGGEYIGFLDADDTIEPQMYEKMYAAAQKYGADIVQCNITDIYPDRKRSIQLSDRDGAVDVTDGAEYMAEYLAGYIHSYEVCNKLFRRKFIVENNLRFADTKIYFSEDMLFNMDAVKYLKRICFIKEPYYNYYQHADSHMHKDAAERLDKMLMLFDDYISGVNGAMAGSASYLAAMATMYNIGKSGALTDGAKNRLDEYIKAARSAKMPVKKRLFLTLARYAPTKLKIRLAELLSRG